MKRLRMRFGLRFFLVGLIVVSILFAWFAASLKEGRRHEQIARELAEAGCFVEMSHVGRRIIGTGPGFIRTENISTLPRIIESCGAAPAFRRITRVGTTYGTDIDTIASIWNQLDTLDAVSFDHQSRLPLTETHLQALLSNVRIRSLDIRAAHLPRTRIPWLNHEGLSTLCVDRTQFCNPAIEDLPVSLEHFNATRTRINDEGLNAFLRLKNLKTLKLRRTPTSKEAVDQLRAKMPWCQIEWQPLLNP